MYVYYNILCGLPGKLYSHINDDIQQCKKMSHQLFGSQPEKLSSEHGKKFFFNFGRITLKYIHISSREYVPMVLA